MQTSGNTIFITGGTSGIGRGLAEAFYQRGNEVIISGRREQRLDEMRRRFPRMACVVLDVTQAEAIRRVARRVISEHPALNWVINNAGVQMQVGFSLEEELDDEQMQTEVNTNLLGPIRVAAAFLPHLVTMTGTKSRLPTPGKSVAPAAALTSPTLINVSSGLAFVPMARYSIYSATKAAMHSWTMSLRQQLRSAGVKVIELIPPYVATELGGPGKPMLHPATGRAPMALNAFIEETMRELESDGEELAIADAKGLVEAASPEVWKKAFAMMNG